MVRPSQERFDLPDFTFYDPRGVRDWAAAYYNSNFNPGHLPNPVGGLLAQTPMVRHDLRKFLLGIAWAQAELAEERRIEQLEKDLFR